MASQRLDYDDAYTTRFTARIVREGEHAGRPALELESTYFYPESGGQEADRGVIGDRAVIDVQTDDAGTVWHAVTPAAAAAAAAEGAAVAGETPAEIDWPRRFDHMQVHTGQHILSAAFERELGAATKSSRLGDERCTIEVDLRTADWRAIERVERAANAVVWEDREVLRHWVDDEGVRRFALRKPPVVTGRIRIVEIPDWDVSACGGTHVRRTGEVGLIKVLRWERVRDNVRFEFVCGGRALADYGWRTEALLEAARRRTLHDRQLIEHLEKAATERDELAKRVRDLGARVAAAEAAERVAGTPGAVVEFRGRWPREEARTFAFKCLELGAAWIAVAAGAPEPFVMLARPKSGTIDLRTLAPELSRHAGGKGGGSAESVFVTAGDAAAARAALEWASRECGSLIGGS